MKKFLMYLILLIGFPFLASGQELSELKAEIESLKSRVEVLEKILLEKTTSDELNNAAAKRCIAITNAGTQCSRNAEPGSDYCWQHKSTYEPNKATNSTTKATTTTATKQPATRVIHTGPRGGQYYINSNGNKVYIKKK
ncbi:MAG: hypothetical protein Q8S24_02420 [Eubacteriales bacterium]|nr:hypothetical protein [Eubacteriales bacterium]